MSVSIIAVLALLALAAGLTACLLAWWIEQERQREAEWARFWRGQFRSAAAELDRRDIADVEAAVRRSASARHARAVQLEAERARRDATTARLRRAA